MCRWCRERLHHLHLLVRIFTSTPFKTTKAIELLHPSEIDEHSPCYAFFGKKTKEVDFKRVFFVPVMQ